MRYAGDLPERHAGRSLPVTEPLPEQLPERIACDVTERIARAVTERLSEQLPERVTDREPVRTAAPVAFTAAHADAAGKPVTRSNAYLNARADRLRVIRATSAFTFVDLPSYSK